MWVALLAAALFGISAPLAKLLLSEMEPLPLAGLLYLGSGVGLMLLALGKKTLFRRNRNRSSEARLKGNDYLYLLGAIFCGGVAAPIALMFGLSMTLGSSASLLLNLEGVLTALLAALIFREAVGRNVWFALALMLAGGVLLSVSEESMKWGFPLGSLLVTTACLMWALDNNLTRHLSDKDPFAIARLKGLAAGCAVTVTAVLFKQPLPGTKVILSALLLGAFSYGASLVLFVYALRHLGAARTGAFFGTAPFIGGAVALLLLSEPVTLSLIAAGVLMAAGVWFVLREAHLHEHSHDGLCHEHPHRHDEHHQHEHEEAACAEPHCHEHEHRMLVHSHAHVPDVHHRHRH